jgi:AmmeMemoRadiSam system protein A
VGSRTIADPELTAEARSALLVLARRALEAGVRGEPAPAVPSLPPLGARRGAFVTLHAGGKLRGCLGHIPCDRPVGHVVAGMASAAAREDPRFPPVGTGELAGVRIEISVLGEPALLAPPRPAGVVVGRDGLMVRCGEALGVLLPQVAAEHGWTAETFLEAACRKAGLAADAWRQAGVDVLTFQADVFGE